MSVLWHDGLGAYTSKPSLIHNYPVTGGGGGGLISFRVPGPWPRSLCISAVDWFQQTPDLQTFGASGTEILIMGFRIKAPRLSTTGIVGIFTAGGAHEQIRIRYQYHTLTGKYFLEVCRMLGSSIDVVLLTTELYPHDKWMFFETRIVFSQTGGSVEWRSGGFSEKIVQNVRTESDVATTRGWAQVRFTLETSTDPAFLTDIYILNEVDALTHPKLAKFLGNCACQTLYPAPTRGTKGRTMEWLGAVSNVPKYRLCVLAGQSNMNGVAALPVPGGVLSTNPYMAIWDRVSGSPALRSLQAGVNNNGHFASVLSVQGPEMGFANAMANYVGQVTAPTPTRTVLIKGAQNASWLYPNLANLTWDPATPGNLYNDLNSIQTGRGNLKKDINDCVTSLGGWSNIDRIDFFWGQGESDALLLAAAQEYGTRLTSLFALIRADFPAPITFHLLVLHQNINPGFTYQQAIRSWQLSMQGVRRINLDTVQLAGDTTHFTADGYNRAGGYMFDSWLAVQDFTSEIDDFATGDRDVNTHLIVRQPQKVAVVPLSGTGFLRGTAVHALRAEAHGTCLEASTTAAVHIAFADVHGSGSHPIDLTFPTTATRQFVTIVDSPISGVPFLEEQMQLQDVGFESV